MENWSNLARVATMRTYSRDNENWNDIVERAIGGNTRKVDVPDWERNALRQLMTDRIAMPAGRGLWFSGTPALDVIGGAALNNCWAVTGDKWEHLVLACDLLMLGGGVGMSVQHKYVSKLPKVRETSISHKNTKDAFYIVPDSREGWCELIRLVLKSYFVTGRKFTYSTCCIRGKGERINGFGGTASGPIPLIECIETISKILDARVGKHVRPIDMADLLTCIGRMVVAGNVRRSAIIIIGDPWDREYLTCKRWDLRPVPVYRQFANFSVAASDIEDLHPSFWRTYEAGEPFGFVNLENIQKYGRMGEEKYDSAILVNPCVPGETEILTEHGYRRIDTLVGKRVRVWNGSEWSVVTPRVTGKDRLIVKVTLDNGQTLNCTENHEFVTRDGKVKAKDLNGHQLAKMKYPVVQGGKHLPNAYSQGFYQGDGETDSHHIKLYGEKKMLLPELQAVGKTDAGKYQRATFTCDLQPKGYVPIEMDMVSRLEWLAGYCDADGTVTNDYGIQITSVDVDVLRKVQKMLTTLGCHCRVQPGRPEREQEMPGGTYVCKPTYRLLIGAVQVQTLRGLGFNPRRLNIDHSPNRDASRFVKVVSVEPQYVADTVYCFTEPKLNQGCFEGIVTGQCAEATLENGEPCNLLELFMSRMKTRDELAFAARLMFRYGKRVCLENYHHDIINEVVHRNNRIGVGITGCLQSRLFNPGDLDFAYEAIQEENRIYSAELGVPESIRTTVVKPSGTLSILGDCTPGIHPAFAEYYIRRVRFADNSPLIPVLRDAGHKIEPQKNIDGSLDYGTLVVDFPVHMPNTPTADQMTTWQQLDIVKMAQRHWADQSVSVTVYYKKPEIEDLKDWVGDNLKYLKTLSFLCYDDHGFEQAPMEKISKEQYERIANKVKPINFSGADTGDLLEECVGGSCPVR